MNIYRDTSNTVMSNSGSAAFGRNNTVPVGFSYAFGENNIIGQYGVGSFVTGGNDTVTSSQAVCLGYFNKVSSVGGVVLGRYLSADNSTRTFVIGEGLGINARLGTNVDDCLLVGFLSTKPTLTVTKSNNNYDLGIVDKTGKVAIGDVTPTAKLHIKSDVGEDASLFLEPKQPTSNNTYIKLRDGNHKISVSSAGLMQITAGNNNLNLSGKNFSVSSSCMDVGTVTERRLTFVAQSIPTIYCNANSSHGILSRYAEGSSYALSFGNDGLLVRTAENQLPSGSEITNWQDVLFVGVDGKITLNGKVGVNAENTTADYVLAVAGGVLANKVIIKSTDIWPDYVFDPGYERMPLNELEKYLETHRHLPDVPSAEEMRKCDGIDLAETQTMLLRKIEELTLYVIELEKRIAELESRASGDTLRFTYDACGNRTGRTLEFSRMDEHDGGKGEEDPDQPEEWLAELNDNFLGSEVALFPNPTEGRFTLAFPDGIPTGAKATLLTLTGTSLSERAVNGTSEEFDLSAQPAGVYLLRLATDKETRTWKVIKRN